MMVVVECFISMFFLSRLPLDYSKATHAFIDLSKLKYQVMILQPFNIANLCLSLTWCNCIETFLQINNSSTGML